MKRMLLKHSSTAKQDEKQEERGTPGVITTEDKS